MNIPHSEEKIEELITMWSENDISLKVILRNAIEYGYLQGIKAAKKVVPEERDGYDGFGGLINDGFNLCRDETLKNLESLSLDSTKE